MPRRDHYLDLKKERDKNPLWKEYLKGWNNPTKPFVSGASQWGKNDRGTGRPFGFSLGGSNLLTKSQQDEIDRYSQKTR